MLYSFKEFYNNSRVNDFWNEHNRVFEVRYEGADYVFTPESIGYADGRISVKVWDSMSGTESSIQRDIYGEWYYSTCCKYKVHTYSLMCAMSNIDCPWDLIDFVKESLRKDPNYKDDIEL